MYFFNSNVFYLEENSEVLVFPFAFISRIWFEQANFFIQDNYNSKSK